MNDLRGIWVARLLRNWEQSTVVACTLKSRLVANVFGVELGDQCRFFGSPVFRRAAHSRLRIGDNCNFRSALRWTSQAGIMRPCTLETLRPGARLVIGNQCGFSGALVAAAQSIELGDQVLCGANVTITDTDWHYIDPTRRREPNPPAVPVRIGNNVWLGMNAIVLKGVTIGDNTVVGAGSVVTKDLPANVIAAGQPARVIKEIPPVHLPENTVLLTGVGYNFVKGTASANLAVEIARAYRQLGYRPFFMPQNPSYDPSEPATGDYRGVPYAYPLRRRNMIAGRGGWRDSLNYRLGIPVNALLTGWVIWRNRGRIAHVFSQTQRPLSLLILGVVCRLAKVPLIYNMVEEPWSLEWGLSNGGWRGWITMAQAALPTLLLYALILRLPRAIACITDPLATLLRRWGHSARKVSVLPNVRAFEAAAPVVGPVEPWLVYTGQISQHKEAVQPLLQALRRINERGIRLRLHIFGNGDAAAIAALRSAIDETGSAGFVTYRGYVAREDMQAALRAAMLCVVLKRDTPFNRYNFPTKLLDYLALAKPVLLSNLALHRQLFSNRHDALLVDPESAEAIREALEWSLAHPEQLAQVGENARRKLRDRFDAGVELKSFLRRTGIVTMDHAIAGGLGS